MQLQNEIWSKCSTIQKEFKLNFKTFTVLTSAIAGRTMDCILCKFHVPNRRVGTIHFFFQHCQEPRQITSSVIWVQLETNNNNIDVNNNRHFTAIWSRITRADLQEQPLDFYEPDVLPAAQPIVSKHHRKTEWFGRLLFYRHGISTHV